jgi:hypothetical protein
MTAHTCVRINNGSIPLHEGLYARQKKQVGWLFRVSGLERSWTRAGVPEGARAVLLEGSPVQMCEVWLGEFCAHTAYTTTPLHKSDNTWQAVRLLSR